MRPEAIASGRKHSAVPPVFLESLAEYVVPRHQNVEQFFDRYPLGVIGVIARDEIATLVVGPEECSSDSILSLAVARIVDRVRTEVDDLPGTHIRQFLVLLAKNIRFIGRAVNFGKAAEK